MQFHTKRDLKVPGFEKDVHQSSRFWSDSPFRFRFNSLADGPLQRCDKERKDPRHNPLTLSNRGGASQSSSQKEKKSGVEFPGEYCHLSKSKCPTLAGIGLREKRILGVKSVGVYAMGFYVDQEAARKALGTRYGDQTVQALADNEELCKEVVASDSIEKTVRVVITNGMVNQGNFLGGLRESLEPACKKVNDKDSFAHFVKLFEGTKFRKGLELAFTSTKAGGLATRIDNKDVGEIPAPGFTQAFFNMYLGPNPVAPNSKKSFAEGLAGIISQSAASLDEE